MASVLLVVEAHPCTWVHPMMPVASGFDAIELKTMGAPALGAFVTKCEHEITPGFLSPEFVSAGHN